jgi:NAD(P)-dependent dehydrogenase (short-subunit alcohol dehydrogenase family)
MSKITIDVEGKTALVLGASKGIGKIIAKGLIDNGARVMLAARNEQLLKEVANELGSPSTVQYTLMDMKDGDSIAAAVKKTIEVFGQLDIAVNNAGIQTPREPLVELDEALYDELMAVNLRGVVLAMKHEIRAMLENPNGGSVVNISSSAGLVGIPTITSYVASKHGVVGATKAAANEYAAKNIRVNAVLPGIIKTELFDAGPGATPEILAGVLTNVPMDRVGLPEEVASSVVWLCSDSASYVTGIALPIDGGFIL